MTKTKEAKVITIRDLEKETGLDSKKIRLVARRLGLKAPETGVEGFGPRKKYGWEEGSKELKQLRKALAEGEEKEADDEDEEE